MREWMAGALGVAIAFLIVAATDTVMLTIYPLPPGTVVSLKTLPEIAASRPVPAAAAFGLANLIGPLIGAVVAAAVARRSRRTVAMAVTTIWALLASVDTLLVGLVWPIAVLMMLPVAGRAIGRAMTPSDRDTIGPVTSKLSTH